MLFLPKRIYKFIRSTIEKLRVFTTETEKLVNTVNENIQDNCEQNDDDEGMKRCALPEITIMEIIRDYQHIVRLGNIQLGNWADFTS